MNEWPTDDDLAMFVRESQEHKRAWALIAGLSNSLLKERRELRESAKYQPKQLQGERPETWNDRIQSLEQRIVKQRKVLETIEECRKFEAATERLLVRALKDIERTSNHSDATVIAQVTLNRYQDRLGPRQTEETSR